MRILWFPRPNHLKSHSSGLKVSIPCRYGIYTSCLFFRGIYTICFFFRKGTLFQHRTPPPTLCSYIAFVLLPTLLLTWLWKGRSYRCTPTFRHNRLCCTRSMPAFQFDEGVVELTIRMSLRPRWANNPHEFCNFILSLHNLSAAQTTHRLIHPHVTNMHSCLQFDKPLSQCTTNQQLTRSYIHVETRYTLLFLILTGWEPFPRPLPPCISWSASEEKLCNRLKGQYPLRKSRKPTMEKPRQSLSPYPHDASQSSVPLLRGMARQYHDQRLAPPLILPHSYAYSASLPSSNWKSLYPVSTTKLRETRGK